MLSYGTRFRRGRPPGFAASDHTVPYGTVLSGDASQALRARLRSCLSLRDEKYILRAEALIKLALMGFKPRAELHCPLRGNKTGRRE